MAARLSHPQPGPGSGTERLLNALAERREQIVEEVLRQRSTVPGYAKVHDPDQLADMAAHVREVFDALQQSIAYQRSVTPEDLAFIRPHIRLRAMRNVSLEECMHAFRVVQRVIWDTVMSTATEEELGTDAAVAVTRPLIDFIDVASGVVADAYLEIQEILVSEGSGVRRDLLEDLLAGREVHPGPRLNAARAAGLGADASCVVVVARPAAARGDDEMSLHTAGSRLASAVGEGVAPLTVVRVEEIVIVAAVHPESIQSTCDKVRLARGQLTVEGLELSVGMSTVHEGLTAVPAAYEEACVALEAAKEDTRVVALPTLSAFDYLTLQPDATAWRLVTPAVRAFVDEDRASGGVLTETLLAYVASDLNVKLAAERLFIHPNTAHYRLSRIGEKTERDLRRFADVIELVVAMRLAGSI